MRNLKFRYNDGGASNAGFSVKGIRDCVARAIAIGMNRPYQEILKEVKSISGNRHRNQGVDVRTPEFKKWMISMGWEWVACMKIGSGCQIHLRADELPEGILIASVSKHWVCIIDHEIQDIFDPSRGGDRCVYGYWIRK